MAVRAAQPVLPRREGSALRGTVWALCGVLGVLFFLFLGFPYAALRERVATELGRVSGAEIAIAELGPGFGLGGLRLVADGVVARWPDGRRLDVERLRLGPAWSLSWLRGRPALAIGLEGPWGRVDGTTTLGETPRVRGRLRELDLDQVPIAWWRPGADLDGTLDARFDLAREGAGLVGSTEFEAREGLLGLPELPLAIPYATLDGALRFGEGALAEVVGLELVGPMVNLSLEGQVGAAATLEGAPLRLSGRLEVSDPALREAFAAQGVRVGADGTRSFRVSGTLGAPELR